MKPILGSILNTAKAIVDEVQSSIYHNEDVLFFQTYAEVYSALLHYLSRVSLHVGGAAFQDSVYGKSREKIIDFFVGVATKIITVSPRSATLELNELCTKREFEYANHSGGYADANTRKGSLIWAIAKNIHSAAGISVANDEEVIASIGDVLARSLASLSLDKQLEHFQKSMK